MHFAQVLGRRPLMEISRQTFTYEVRQVLIEAMKLEKMRQKYSEGRHLPIKLQNS